MMECPPHSEDPSPILMHLPAQDNDVMSGQANIVNNNNNNNNNNSSSTVFHYGDSAQSLLPPIIVETGTDSPTSNCLSPHRSDFLSTADVNSSSSNNNNTLQNSTVICTNGQGRPSVVLETVSGQGRFTEVQGRESGSFSWLTAAVVRSEEAGSGLGEKRHSRHSHASTGSTSSESSSAGKRARRLVKKVTSMTPGTHWRRLRNTLKAAQEMQTNKKKQVLSREDSFLRKFSTRNQRLHSQVLQPNDNAESGGFPGIFNCNSSSPRAFKPPRHFAVQHDGNFMFNWLAVVTLAVLYNLWTCILRQAFREVQESCNACWITIDVLCDLVYLLDILVQFRTGYLNQGLMVYDSKKLAVRYVRSRLLYADALCLLPLDFVQLYIGLHPMIRFPRFLKVYRTFRFIHMLESRTAYPNLIRVANLTHILFLGAHWFAAFYYMISEAEDFKGKWSYPRPEGEYAYVSRKYLASLFWSTLTLTTIGDLPPPENGKDYGMSNAAYVFVIVSYLLGVFVFATIVGQVGNVINNRNASRQEFERLLDGAKVYMQTHNVPSDLQKRVQRWYDYVWSRGRLNGCDINSLGLLPDKLKTELAIHVNLETLKKVTIFQECQPEFLHDLVLKMKAYIFTPGDLICRRGEVAREMFIIADGVVEIISENGTILKQMGAGDFFGEIGILNLDGGINRRSADVRSVGYSELFVLSRDDVLGALKDHPDAESIIRDYGQRRLREIEAHRQKVKPLKQMGTMAQLPTVNNRHRLSMRPIATNTTTTATTTGRCTSPTRTAPGANVKVCLGGKTTDRYAHTCTGPGGKTYTYCYTGDDMDSQISASPETYGRFQSFISSVRQIFHRKARRQKPDEDSETGCDTGMPFKFPWACCDNSVAKEGRGVCLCCSNGSDVSDEGECTPRSTAPELCMQQRVTQLLHSSPGGCYAPVLSEDDECNQFASPQSPRRQSVSTDAGNKEVKIRQHLAARDVRPDETSNAAKSPSDNQTVVEMNYVQSADRAVETNPCRALPPSCNHSDSKCRDSSSDNDAESASLDRSLLEMGRAEIKAPKKISVNQTGTDLKVLGKDQNTQEQCAASDGQFAVRTFENFPSSSPSTMRSEKQMETLNKCVNCEDLELPQADKPAIRVDSASTLESADSADLGINRQNSQASCSDVSAGAVLTTYSSNHASDASRKNNFLHPEYSYLSPTSSNDPTHEDSDADTRPCRCRSHSAPDIFRQECSRTLAQHKAAEGATSLPSSGTAVDVGFLVAPPISRRRSYAQSATERLLPWSKPAGVATTHVQPTCDVSVDQENIVGRLFQLQTSHDQLHIRMRELEEAYLTNIHMLEKLKDAQADMLILLTDSLHRAQQRPKSRSRSKSCHSATFELDGDLSAL